MTEASIENYQELAQRTSATATLVGCAVVRERLADDVIIRLLHGSCGLVTEAGEIIDQVKKYLFYGKRLDVAHLFEEAGDGFWYLAEILCAIDRRFLDCMQANINKLRARFPDSYNDADAIDRDPVAEKEAMQS